MNGPSTFMGRIEAGGEAVCVLVGVAAFLLAWRAAPAPSLRLHGRARGFFLAALTLFVLAESSSLVELWLDLEPRAVLLAGLSIVVHEAFQVGFVACLGAGVWYMMKAEPEEVQALRRFAEEDSLTSLHNRHYLERTVQPMVEFSKRRGLPLCCVMMDVDDFKLHNDALGHAAGDAILTGVADVLRRATRPSDAVVRYGGEEFVVITSCPLREAYTLAERLRVEVEGRFTTADGDAGLRPVTASFGVAALTDDMEGARQMIAASDAELYRAKRTGKNRVSVAL